MSKNKPGVYSIMNIENNRIYIGSSKNVYERIKQHQRELKINKHENDYLQNDYNKCGIDAFIYIVLEECSIDNMLIIEQRYLDKYFDNKKKCYNILPAAGNNLGYLHTEESKKKMSEAQKGKIVSDETREKISQNSYRRHKVNQYDLAGQFLKTYDTIKNAIENNPECRSSKIAGCCLLNRRSAGGYMWRYYEDFPNENNIEPYETFVKERKSTKGCKQTEETKRKISQTLKGRPIHPNTLARLLDPEKNPFAKSGKEHPAYGKKMPKEACEAISKALKGREKTEEHCKHISEALKGKPMKEETKAKLRDGRRKGTNNANAKKVAQYDLEGNLIKVWDMISLAAEAVGVSIVSISQCCNGRSKTSAGFVWKHVEKC